jgi:hypothetical protein
MLYTDEPVDYQADTLSVLRKDIPWDIYQTARLITDRDLQLLRRFDKKDKAYQAKLLEEVSGLAPRSLGAGGPEGRLGGARRNGGRPGGRAAAAPS